MGNLIYLDDTNIKHKSLSDISGKITREIMGQVIFRCDTIASLFWVRNSISQSVFISLKPVH